MNNRLTLGAVTLISALAVLAVVLLMPQAALATSFGALAQFPSPNDCFAPDTAATGCGTTAAGLLGAHGIAISPDGRNLYVAARGSGAVAEFQRNADGSVSQLASPNKCITSSSNPDPACGTTMGPGLTNAGGVVVSPDGQNVYTVAFFSDAIAEFTRNSDGSLTQLTGSNACIKESVGPDAGCTTGKGLLHAEGIAISPDGKNVYVTAFGDTSTSSGSAVAEFARNADGTLTQLSSHPCVTATTAAADPDCGIDKANSLLNPTGIVVSPDGANVYVDAYGASAVLAFTRGTDGSLTQVAPPGDCVTETASGSTCGRTGFGLNNPDLLAITPDQKNVYVAAYHFDSLAQPQSGVAELSRGSDGSLMELPFPDNCITVPVTGDLPGVTGNSPGCGRTGPGLVNAHGVAVSPDGRSVYVAAKGGSGSGTGVGSSVAAFQRSLSDGSLTQLTGSDSCIRNSGSDGGDTGCPSSGPGLFGAAGIAVSPDPNGLYVYVGAFGDGSTGSDGALAEFARRLPPACSDAVASAPNGPVRVPLACSDPDGDAVTRSITAGPSHGTLGSVDQAAGTVSYSPAPGYSGPDSFTFAASDGSLASSPATARLTVVGPPTASIFTPPNTGTYSLNQIVATRFSCVEDPFGPGLRSCSDSRGAASPGALDTSILGAHTYSVTAVSADGQTATAQLSYSVVPVPVVRVQAPELIALSVAPGSFRVAPRASLTSRQMSYGAVITFRLSAAATTTFGVSRVFPGRRNGKRCVAPTRATRRANQCSRYLMMGGFARAGAIGLNRVRFSGWLGARRLSPGAYQLVGTPRAGAVSGRAAYAGFRVIA